MPSDFVKLRAMGQKQLIFAVCLSAVVGVGAPQSADAKGYWVCDGAQAMGQAEVRAEREALLTQSYYVTADGRVDTVKIVIEQPRPLRDAYEAVVHGVMQALGLRKPDPERTPALDRPSTQLASWNLSPFAKVRRRIDTPC